MQADHPTARPGPQSPRRRRTRRRRLLTRAAPLLALAALAFAVGVITGGEPRRAESRIVHRYVAAWQRGDVPAMYALLDRSSRARVPEARFAAMLRTAAATATVRSMRAGRIAVSAGGATVAMTIRTRVWGVLREPLTLSLSGAGAAARVRLASAVLFPGLHPDQTLTRHTVLPARARLLAADGAVLAAGPHEPSPVPAVAGEVVGTLGAIPAAERSADASLGYPPDARVGLDGLELVFQRRLAGRPGGTLSAGRRVLARAQPLAAPAVRSTIVPAVESAVLDAIGNRYGGMVVLTPGTGALQAAADLAYDAPQPPGSTMKIVTSTALLQDGLATIASTYPFLSAATIDGYTLHNAGNEVCGGTLLNAFATSCNSTFAPLGVALGARRLVAEARRYGFDEPAPIPGAAESTIPSAADMGGPVAIGSSAIGQGRVLATPLEVADVAATIADGGRRPLPTYAADAPAHWVDVTTPAVAGQVQRMMIAVIASPDGTGAGVAIPGITLAGKTGTAELRDTAGRAASANPRNTDSWFVAYGPIPHPRVVVAALFPGAGYGAATAAPAVREVIQAALAH